MAPSRTSSKRKVDADTDNEEQVESQQTHSSQKKLKRTATTAFESDQPRNKEMPSEISIPPKSEGTIRIAAWNICGFAASLKKGFRQYVEAEDPDILLITETKMNDTPVDPALKARFPYQYWSISAKKGYSGTAFLSKYEAISVDNTLPGHPDPSHVKGRIVTLEFESCYLVGTYVVNAGDGLKTLNEKNTWNEHFTSYIRSLDAKKPVIWTGDLNVAPTELDLSDPKKKWNKVAGYTEAETTAIKNILTHPEDPEAPTFIDVWRHLHPEVRNYSFFSYRGNCRTKGLGWRLDMFVVSERLLKAVKLCKIRDEIYGASDHCPLVLDIEGPL